MSYLSTELRDIMLQSIKVDEVTHIKIIDANLDSTSGMLPISWNNASNGSIVQDGNVDYEFEDTQPNFTKVELHRYDVSQVTDAKVGEVDFDENVTSTTAGTIRISDLTINLPE